MNTQDSSRMTLEALTAHLSALLERLDHKFTVTALNGSYARLRADSVTESALGFTFQESGISGTVRVDFQDKISCLYGTHTYSCSSIESVDLYNLARFPHGPEVPLIQTQVDRRILFEDGFSYNPDSKARVTRAVNTLNPHLDIMAQAVGAQRVKLEGQLETWSKILDAVEAACMLNRWTFGPNRKHAGPIKYGDTIHMWPVEPSQIWTGAALAYGGSSTANLYLGDAQQRYGFDCPVRNLGAVLDDMLFSLDRWNVKAASKD